MERHYIQLHILFTLLEITEGKFSALNTREHPTDQFNFHLQKLVKEKLVEKTEEGLYHLTNTGLELAGRLDKSVIMPVKQPKLSISLGIFRNNDSEVLILKRLRDPSLGKLSWHDSKWRFGKSSFDEISRVLSEETGLEADDFVFNGITHIIREEQGEIEADIVLLHYKITDPTGELISETKDGMNDWFSIDEIRRIPSGKKLVGFNERLEAYISGNILQQEFWN